MSQWFFGTEPEKKTHIHQLRVQFYTVLSKKDVIVRAK